MVKGERKNREKGKTARGDELFSGKTVLQELYDYAPEENRTTSSVTLCIATSKSKLML